MKIKISSWTIQLFRERLSHKSVKAYATIPKGFKSNSCLPLLHRSSSCFNAMEGDSMITYVHGFSFLLAKTQCTAIKQRETAITHKTFRHNFVCAFMLLYDNLSRNRCICNTYPLNLIGRGVPVCKPVMYGLKRCLGQFFFSNGQIEKKVIIFFVCVLSHSKNVCRECH